MQSDSLSLQATGQNFAATRSEAGRAAAFAVAFGAFLIILTGFAHTDALHNGAHNTRHALSFPATDVIRKVLAVAVATGLLVGLAMAVVLQFTTTPLILKAEIYEKTAHPTEGKSIRIWPRPGSLVLSHPVHSDHAAKPAAHADSGWQPAEGFQRTAATSVATIAVALGYALLLIGCMVSHERIDPTRGLLWGIAGFAASGLAPALGLAPELPGSAAGDLLLRQFWWAATVGCTAIGLYLLVRRPQTSAKAAGVALLVAPHLVGAPHPDGFESTAPAELAASFAATSLVVHALLWCLVGLGVGWFWTRLANDAPFSGVGAKA